MVHFRWMHIFVFIYFYTSSNNGASALTMNRKTPNTQEQNSSEMFLCERISSSEAASMISNAYEGVLNPFDGKADQQSSLLLITSDASRGAKRLTGMTSILREIQCKEDDTARRQFSEYDRVTVATRRTQSKNARDVSKSEVAAVALGIRAAINHIAAENRRNVLFLTDSTSVLDYYCVEGKHHISATLMNDRHFKAMKNFVEETTNNYDADGKQCPTLVFMAKVKSNKMETDGFFDHDAADIISSLVKNISNKDIEKIYLETDYAQDYSDHTTTSAADSNTVHVVAAPSLRSQDLGYLSESEVKHAQVSKPQVIVKRERGKRLARCKQRMFDELRVGSID